MKIHHNLKKINLALVAGVFLSLFAFTACDSSNALLESNADVASEVFPSIANLSNNLDLSAEQVQGINDILAKRGEAEPGTLWYVAAEMQATLSAEQKAELLSDIEERPARMERGPRQNGFQRGLERGRGELMEEILGDLTDEQKEQLKALYEKQREEMKTFIEERRQGNVDREAMKETMKETMEARREAIEAELATILSEDQLAALKAARENRRAEMREKFGEDGERGPAGRRGGRSGGEFMEAFKEAKIEALGLSETQQSQIGALMQSQKEKAEAILEEFRNSEDGREGVKEKMTSLRDETRAEMEEILTEDQVETIAIQRALAFNMAKNRSGDSTGYKAGRRGSRRFNR